MNNATLKVIRLILEIYFDKGTLVFKNLSQEIAASLEGVKWDERTNVFRSPAFFYRKIILEIRKRKIPYKDFARKFKLTELPLKNEIIPRDFQKEGIDAWLENGSQGVVSLPTGAGKTILAVLLIEKVKRPTLVHVPTIDLMQQWHSVLQNYFDEEIGLLGGGYKEITNLTVATYDSALLHVMSKGDKFGFLIFDECHHLPSTQNQYTALSSIAPFRLGLTATPERTDGKEDLLYKLVGNLCYTTHIYELEGSTLAPYKVLTLEVHLSPEEQKQYDLHREKYINFLRAEKINMSEFSGWKNFLWKSSRTPAGRDVFKSYLIQKKLSQVASQKIQKIWELIKKHKGDRIIIFTQENEMAYRIGKTFLLPVLTHLTKLKERESFLNKFRNGEFSILVTSKVLNEGVDVPEANVGIIVSGSGSVREHVQRLGRILRGKPGKQAFLYELVSQGTGEHFVNQRRRQHSAYEGPRLL